MIEEELLPPPPKKESAVPSGEGDLLPPPPSKKKALDSGGTSSKTSSSESLPKWSWDDIKDRQLGDLSPISTTTRTPTPVTETEKGVSGKKSKLTEPSATAIVPAEASTTAVGEVSKIIPQAIEPTTIEKARKDDNKPLLNNYIDEKRAEVLTTPKDDLVMSGAKYVVDHANQIANGSKEFLKSGGELVGSAIGLEKPQTWAQATGSALGVLKGAADMVFGGLSFTPEGALFNIGSEALPEEVGKFMFTPVTKIAEIAGYHAGENVLLDKAITVGDLAASIGIMHGLSPVIEGTRSALKSKSTTPEQVKEVKSILNNATEDDLHKAFEQNGYVPSDANSQTGSYLHRSAIVKKDAGDFQGAVKDLDAGIIVAENTHTLKNLWAEKADIFSHLMKDKSLGEKFIEAFDKEHNPLHDQVGQDFFIEKYLEAKNKEGEYTANKPTDIVAEEKKPQDATTIEKVAPKVEGEGVSPIKEEVAPKTKTIEQHDTPSGKSRIVDTTPQVEQKVEQNPKLKVLSEAHPKENIDFANQMIDNNMFASLGERNDQRLDIGMSDEEITRAIKDIKDNKNSVASKNLIDKLTKIKESGDVPFIQGQRGVTERTSVPLSELDLKPPTAEEGAKIDELFGDQPRGDFRDITKLGKKTAERRAKEEERKVKVAKAMDALDRLTKRTRKNIISDEEKPDVLRDLGLIADHLVSELKIKGEDLVQALKDKVGEAYHSFIDENKDAIIKPKEKAAEEPQDENKFVSSMKQRHLNQDWLAEAKAKAQLYDKKAGEVYSEVVNDFNSGKIKEKEIRKIVDKAINKEGLNERDASIISVDRTRLKNIKSELESKIEKAKTGSAFDLEQLQNDKATIDELLDRNEQASFEVGQRFGKIGNILQVEAKEDYTPQSIVRDMDKRNINNLDISVEKAKAKELAKQLEESEKKYNELKKKASQKLPYTKRDLKNIDDWGQKAKVASDKLWDLLKPNFDLPEGMKSAGFDVDKIKELSRTAIDAVTESIKKGVELADAIKEQIEKFKQSDFYKSLTDKDKKIVGSHYEDVLNKSHESTSKSAELKSSYEQTLERSIKKNEEKLSTYKPGEVKTKEPRVLSAKEKELFDKNTELKKELARVRKSDTVRAHEIRKKSKETRLLRAEPQLEAQLKDIEQTGDYTKPIREDIPLSPDMLKVATNVQHLRNKIAQQKAKVDFKNSSWGTKALFYAKKVVRFSILSGIKVLGKLATAAAERVVFDIPDIVATETFGKIFPDFAKESPEHFPLGFKEAFKVKKKAMQGMFDNYGSNILSILKTGQDDIALKYGKESKEWHEHGVILDFWNGVHGILKNPVKRMGFLEGLQRATAFATYHGMPLEDIGTQTFIAEVAQHIGKRKIFLQDNDAANWIRNSIQQLGDKYPVAGYFAYSDVPITKVPTNFIGEHLERSFGLITAPGHVLKDILLPATSEFAKGKLKKGEKVTFGKAINNAVSKLTPKQVDTIIRQFAYGTTGAAIFAIGYYNHEEVKKVLDFLPEWAKHHPMIVLMNMGVKTGEVTDATKELMLSEAKAIGEDKTLNPSQKIEEMKTLETKSPVATGFKKGAGKELVTEITRAPLLSTVVQKGGQLAIATRGENTMDKVKDFFQNYMGEKVTEVNPAIVRNIAEWLDTDQPGFHPMGEVRPIKPKGFVQEVKAGSPFPGEWGRGSIPTDRKKAIAKMYEGYDEKSKEEQKKIDDAFDKKQLEWEAEDNKKEAQQK